MGSHEARVLRELYRCMRESYSNSCYGVDGPSDELMKALGEAENLGLTWGKFQDMHEQFAEEGKKKSIRELERGELEIILMKRDGDVYVVSCGEKIKLDSGTTFEDYYNEQMNKMIANVRDRKVDRKFPDGKVISRRDSSKAENYFHENLRY